MVLDIKVKKNLPSVKGLIDSLRQGAKLLHGRDPDLLTKGLQRSVHNRQEELLSELSKYVDPLNKDGSNFEKISGDIKQTISDQSFTTTNFRDGTSLKKGGRHTKRSKRGPKK
jgi:hypothetical protein